MQRSGVVGLSGVAALCFVEGNSVGTLVIAIVLERGWVSSLRVWPSVACLWVP